MEETFVFQWSVISSLLSILAKSLLHRYKFDSINMVYYTALYATMILVLHAMLLEGNGVEWLNTHPYPWSALIIIFQFWVGKNSNIVASGGEVFMWDIEAALAPVSKSNDATVDKSTNGIANSLPSTNLRNISSSNNISLHTIQTQGYIPIAAKGHKESVYALAMNEGGSNLVSDGTKRCKTRDLGN